MLLMNVGVCVRVLRVFNTSKHTVQKYRIERTSPSPYQAGDSVVLGRHEITTKCLRTQVGNHARALLRAQLQGDRHKNTQHRQKQPNSPTCTDSFTLVSLEHVPIPPCRYVDAFLQWCVRKYTSQFRITRTLPNTIPVYMLTIMLPSFRCTPPNLTSRPYCPTQPRRSVLAAI